MYTVLIGVRNFDLAQLLFFRLIDYLIHFSLSFFFFFLLVCLVVCLDCVLLYKLCISSNDFDFVIFFFQRCEVNTNTHNNNEKKEEEEKKNAALLFSKFSKEAWLPSPFLFLLFSTVLLKRSLLWSTFLLLLPYGGGPIEKKKNVSKKSF